MSLIKKYTVRFLENILIERGNNLTYIGHTSTPWVRISLLPRGDGLSGGVKQKKFKKICYDYG